MRLKALEQERKQREAEEARLRAVEEESRERAQREKEEKRRQEEKRQVHARRREQLLKTLDVLQKVEKDMKKINERLKDVEEWERLMRCDGLPDPKSVPELNRYVSLWRADTDSNSLQGCFDRTPQVIQVISDLEATMEEFKGADAKQDLYWREIWLELQEAQRMKLNQATYGQLLDLRPHLNYETMVYSFVKTSQLVSVALWCNTTRSPKNTFHSVEELGFTFQLPSDLVEQECVIRIMRTDYDHYSKFARTFCLPSVDEIHENILDYIEPEPEIKETPIKVAEEEGEEKESKGEDKNEEESTSGPKEQEEEAPAATSPYLTATSPGELNLRRCRVQGGVFTLDLLAIPPQPRVVADCTITQVEDDPTVVNLPWKAAYNPPPPPDAADQRRRNPEEVETEMRLLELELQKLILITIKLPDSAFWFEPPHMVRWDHQRSIWTTDGFHNIKYNEDTCTLQVRSISLGVMGLAMNRFANLPYQNWELSPKDTNSASLTLYGSVVSAEFTITEGQVSVVHIQDGGRKVLTHLYGNLMKPNILIEILRFYGINLFSDRDSFCYMDGLPLKHKATERHLYATMGLLASSLAFQWSRWNLLAGENKIVFQMKTKGAVNEEGVGSPLVVVTPMYTTIVECTEISQAFSDKPRADIEMYSDLYHMATQVWGDDVMEQCKESASHFVYTVTHMLESASILSYC